LRTIKLTSLGGGDFLGLALPQVFFELRVELEKLHVRQRAETPLECRGREHDADVGLTRLRSQVKVDTSHESPSHPGNRQPKPLDA
jgi:hypothetical protein